MGSTRETWLRNIIWDTSIDTYAPFTGSPSDRKLLERLLGKNTQEEWGDLLRKRDHGRLTEEVGEDCMSMFDQPNIGERLEEWEADRKGKLERFIGLIVEFSREPRRRREFILFYLQARQKRDNPKFDDLQILGWTGSRSSFYTFKKLSLSLVERIKKFPKK